MPVTPKSLFRGTLTTTDQPLTTWTVRRTFANFPWVGYGNSTYMAVSTLSSSPSYTSTDAVTWTQRGNVPATHVSNGVAYGNGVWVSAGASSGYGATSADNGVTWTVRTQPANFAGITFGNGLFVAASASNASVLYTSTDGINWPARTLPVAQVWVQPAFSGGLWVAIGGVAAAAAASTDGLTWNSRTMPFSRTWTGLGYGNGFFLATTNTSSGYVSTDGTTWTGRSVGYAAGVNQPVYGGGVWLASPVDTPTTPVMIVSLDGGTTWTTRSPGTPTNIVGQTYGHAGWVAVSNYTNLYSTPGYGTALYLSPAATTAVITGVVVANPTASAATVTLVVDGIAVLNGMSVAPFSQTVVPTRQVVTTGKYVNGYASANLSVHISGVEQT